MPLFALVLVAAGIGAALWKGQGPSRAPHEALRPRALYLPFVALGIQWWALTQADGRQRLAFIVLSFAALAVFVLHNRRHRPMWLLLCGMALNLAPMLLHNGYMPITTETVATLFPSHHGQWPLGLLHPGSKDVIVDAARSPLWFLGDTFALGSPFPVPTAFSIGDILILAGYLWAVTYFMNRQRQPSSTAS